MLLGLFKRLTSRTPPADKQKSAAELLDRAVELRGEGDISGAIKAFREFLEIEPSHLQALNDLGGCLAHVGRLQEAENVFELTYSLDDTFIPAIVNHAKVLVDQRRGNDAMEFLRRAKIADPEFLQTDSIYATLRFSMGDVQRATQFQLRSWLSDFDSLRHANGYLFWVTFGEIPEDRMAAEHRFWAETVAPVARPVERAASPRSDRAGRRIRIGYWSSDFRGHSVRYFFRPLLENHDRERFEVFLYHDSPHHDAHTDLIRAAGEHFHDIHEMSDAALSELIASHDLDVLADITGHTSHNRLHLLQQRLAPLQVTALGYPPTTGLRSIDVKFIDRHAASPGHSRFYAEMPVELPRSFWCFDPLEELPDPAPPPVLEKGYITFGCVGNISKITDRMLHAWKEVMDRVPGSRLLVRAINFYDPESLEATKRMLEGAGIDPGRCDFRQPEGGLALWESYAEIDIIFDTFPFNGGTTTCICTYMGVPVVSLMGESLVSRMGASILANLGVPDLAVATVPEYIERAVALAGDTEFLARFRGAVRERFRASSLGNGEMYARDWEQACEDLLARIDAGGLGYTPEVPALPAGEIMRRAYAVARHGQPDATRRIVDHCLRAYPDYTPAHLMRAQQLALGADVGGAVAYLREQAQRAAPADQVSLLILAVRFEMLVDRIDAARELVERLRAQEIADPFDRLQVQLFEAALAPREFTAVPATREAMRIRVVVPCDDAVRFDTIRRQLTSTCACPAGWVLAVERCVERRRVAAYSAALADNTHDAVVFLQKNIEVHNPNFLIEVANALADADVVGFAGARRWVRIDWRADEYEQKAGAFLTDSRERDGLVDVHLAGGGRETLADGMAVLDGGLLAARTGLAAEFDEELVGSDALLEDFWSSRMAAAGRRLRVHRNLGIYVDPRVELDASNRTEARMHCAELLRFDPFSPSDDYLALSVPAQGAGQAARIANAFLEPSA